MNRYMIKMDDLVALVYAAGEDQITEKLAEVCKGKCLSFEAPVWKDDFLNLRRFYLSSEEGVMRFQRAAMMAESEYLHAALNEAYVEAQAPEQILETGQRAGLATLRAAQPTYDELRQRLLDLAAGARSKADLLASQSPTSRYINPVDVLRAVAKEAGAVLGERPALEIQRMLVLSTGHLPGETHNFLSDQHLYRVNQGDRADTPHELVVDAIGEYGWRICLTDPACEQYLVGHEQGDPLHRVLCFAIAQGCDWLALDRDGYEVDGLPIYEEED